MTESTGQSSPSISTLIEEGVVPNLEPVIVMVSPPYIVEKEGEMLVTIAVFANPW